MLYPSLTFSQVAHVDRLTGKSFVSSYFSFAIGSCKVFFQILWAAVQSAAQIGYSLNKCRSCHNIGCHQYNFTNNLLAFLWGVSEVSLG